MANEVGAGVVDMAMGHNLWLHFGVGAAPIFGPILVVGLGCSLGVLCDLDFDPDQYANGTQLSKWCSAFQEVDPTLQYLERGFDASSQAKQFKGTQTRCTDRRTWELEPKQLQIWLTLADCSSLSVDEVSIDCTMKGFKECCCRIKHQWETSMI